MLRRAIIVVTRETLPRLRDTVSWLARYGIAEPILRELSLGLEEFARVGARAGCADLEQLQRALPRACGSYWDTIVCSPSTSLPMAVNLYMRRPTTSRRAPAQQASFNGVWRVYETTIRRVWVEPREQFGLEDA